MCIGDYKCCFDTDYASSEPLKTQVILCYVTLCYVILCLGYITLYYVMLRYVSFVPYMPFCSLNITVSTGTTHLIQGRDETNQSLRYTHNETAVFDIVALIWVLLV